MEGITILATNAINMEASILATIGVIFGFTIAVVFLASALGILKNDTSTAGIFTLIAVGGFLLCIISGIRASEQMEVFSHYEYKVLIDDSVSLNEFNEKYEILDQEGQIYTVIEREVEE